MMSRNLGRTLAVVALAAATYGSMTAARAQTVVTIGIGTQDTTTNTVTAGTIIRQLNLLEKYLPKDGKYANLKFVFEWNNFTSGPPVTNGMMANKLQFGMMGDYPLVVNGFTFQSNPESKSRLIAVAAYNRFGSATASSSTRSRRTSSSPTSRASWSACRLALPPMAWCLRRCRTAAGPPTTSSL
jgi:NitT/TauT family transport system substrate-binding protein